MALTVASIAQDSANDVRNVLDPVANLNLFTMWIDRINKDCLHSSVYSYLNITTTSFNTVVGQNSYILTPTNIRRILGVYDFSRQRILFPIERATSPVSQVEKQETNPGQQGSPSQVFGTPAQSPISLQVAQPGYFRHLGAQVLNLYPTPQAVIQLNVSYEQQVATLVNPTDPLGVPDDARDMIVAGVNFHANMYLKRPEEAQVWASFYNTLKHGESLV